MARRRSENDDLDYVLLDALRAGEEDPSARSGLDAEEAAALAGLERLERDLAASAGQAIEVPPEVDRRILADASALLFAASRRRRLRLLTVSAAAAALLIAATLFVLEPWREPPVTVALRGDVDRSGAVDIVDAYRLALRLENDGALERAWDMNGDGAIDRRDVDAIAERSVALGGPR